MREQATNTDFLPGNVDIPPIPSPAKLTPQEAIFCQFYAETRSVAGAMRTAYPGMTKGKTHLQLWRAGAAMMARPEVTARIQETQDRLAAASVVRAIEIMRDLADIATTDINEIVRHTRHNCRHCNGVNHAYQWRDAAEFARQFDAYCRQEAEPKDTKRPKDWCPIARPDAAGGFGYEMQAEPNPACPHCYGEGFAKVTITDTTKLSPAAQKCIKGIKQDKDGVVTIETHDQLKAYDMLLKMLGAYKNDGKGLPLTGSAPLDGISTAELNDPREAAQAYIRMLAPAK
jgi:phage terminase small subunit